MFFPDNVQGYREARRVLKPGGLSIFNVWDRISDNEFAFVVTEALKTLFPGDPANFLARTAHGYHDVGTIAEELRAAAFSAIFKTLDHTLPIRLTHPFTRGSAPMRVVQARSRLAGLLGRPFSGGRFWNECVGACPDGRRSACHAAVSAVASGIPATLPG